MAPSIWVWLALPLWKDAGSGRTRVLEGGGYHHPYGACTAGILSRDQREEVAIAVDWPSHHHCAGRAQGGERDARAPVDLRGQGLRLCNQQRHQGQGPLPEPV